MTDTDVDALMELVVQGIEVAGVLSSRAPAAVMCSLAATPIIRRQPDTRMAAV
jgi:hypothetical protein